MSASFEQNEPLIPSLDRCPVTGLPIRHDPRWVIAADSPQPYRAEFSVIGLSIVHAHINGFTTLEISKRYLDSLDALCDEIGAPVFLLEDYALHKGTSGEARNYYLMRQRQNRRIAASIFFSASPFFGAVIRVGRFFAKVPFFVEIAPDYTAAVKLATGLQKKIAPALPQAPLSAPGEAEKTFEWQLENGAFSVTYKLLPGNILFNHSRGTFRSPDEVREFKTVISRLLGEWFHSGNEYYRLMDWTGLRYASMKARSLYLQSMTELQKEYPCKLAVVYGMSPFIRAAFAISRPFLSSIPLMTASNFDDGLLKIRSCASSRQASPAKEPHQGKVSLDRADFESQLRNLIDYIGTINWEQCGITIETPASDIQGPFKPVYEALMVLKQDFDEIMREKQESETQQRELEEKLRHSEKIQAIGQLAGGIAHDFNNQLTTIIGFAELLKHKVSNNVDVCKYADTILQTSKRTAELTSQLLAFARKGKYLSVDVDVHEIIEGIIPMLEHSIDKRIILLKELAAPLPVITGDPGRIQSALLNIAINARDAMPQGGTLRFSTGAVSLSGNDIMHPAFDLTRGDYVRICISDTGCGMNAEVQKHLFEPFFTTKEKGKGTGMGLAAVYGTVKSHKGAVRIRSEQGHGTTVELLFPRATPKIKNSAIALVAEKEETPPRAYTVMLIEDEASVRMMVSEMLSRQGHAVIPEVNGKEAVERYAKSWREIDLIILDLIMPVMSGPETFHELRKINPGAKILISSGYSIEGDAETLITAGAKGFLEKPFSIAEISKAIRLALQ